MLVLIFELCNEVTFNF